MNLLLYIGPLIISLLPPQITLVWNISPGFELSGLSEVLRSFKPQEGRPGNEYELKVWRIDGLMVKYYQKKLVAQGVPTVRTKELLRKITNLDGLSLDDENESKFKGLFPTRQNAIVCPKCREDSLVTEGIVIGLDVSFRRECGHVDKLQPPIFMLTNRVLPDLNIMISKTLSRLVRLGYFNGFEVVVPEFLLDVVDGFKGAGSKRALSAELDELRTLEGEGRIRLLSLQHDPITENDEDKKILGLSELTNAILITGDDVLKNRAVMRHRPTIFIQAEVFAQIKMLDEVRVP